MKTQIIIGGFITFIGVANAQTTWNFSGTNIYNANTGGNVGIDTSTPNDKLDVRGNTSLGDGFLPSDLNWSTPSSERRLMLAGSSSGGTGTMFVCRTGSPASGQILGAYAFGQRIGGTASGANAGIKAAITAQSNGVGGSTTGYGADLIFQTTPNNTGVICTERMRIDMNGNVGVGTISTGARVEAVQSANPTGYATAGSFFSEGASQTNVGIRADASNASYNNAATFATTGGSTQNIGVTITNNASGTPSNDWGIYCIGRTWCTLGVWTGSDKKIKDNIKPLENMMDKIKLLKPSTYTFKTTEFKGLNLPQGEQIGLIAQDVEQVFPGIVSNSKGVTQKNGKGEVTVDAPDLKSVNYPNLIPVLIAGIQEQQAQIENLSTRVDAQQKQIADQKAMIDALVNKAGTSTGINEMNTVPSGFNMDQNVPNPFNNETVINYTLPTTVANASLVVYDLTGKQVSSFPLTEKGSSSITITSEKLAAGIYIYSVMADGKIIDSKRMVVANK